MSTYSRLNDVLMQQWQSLQPGAGLPLEADIDPDSLYKVWSDCFLVHLKGDRFYYEYLGQNLIEAYGDKFMTEQADRLISIQNHQTTRKFEEVASTEKPVRDEGEFENSQNLLIKYRQLLLPFTNIENGHVTHILGGMRWKAC